MTRFDAVLVGFGLHALTLLASAPELLRLNLAIVEQSAPLGGSMSHYLATTNSAARKFLRPFARAHLLQPCFAANPSLRELADDPNPVRCQRIGHALRLIGEYIIEHSPNLTVFAPSAVTLIDERDDAELLFRLADGTDLLARVGILATGRRELVHEGLRHFKRRVLLSSDLVKRGLQAIYDSDDDPRRVATIGGSHSGFSVLELMFDRADPPPFEVDVYYRSPIALYYESVERALSEPRTPGERHFDLSRDVCPETGAVFRDSGLRGLSKRLFQRIALGEIATVRLIAMEDVRGIGDRLDRYDWIVQALGSSPRVPALRSRGQPVWSGNGSDWPTSDAQHRVIVPTTARQPRPIPLFLVRVLPTREEDKDRNPGAHDVYQGVASEIFRALGLAMAGGATEGNP